MGMILLAVLAVVAVEALILAGAALSRMFTPPINRRSLVAVWLIWNALPAWWVWRAGCGWVLRRASAAAVRACDQHERAQATATFPSAPPRL